MALSTPGLVKAANQMILDMVPEMNLVRLFAYDISDSVADAGTKVRITFATGGTATPFNVSSNNYEKPSGSLGDVFVTLDTQPKATIPISGADTLELDNPYWDKLAEACSNSVRASISATIGGLFTTSNCTGGAINMDTVTKAGVAGLRTECVGRVADNVLLLAPDYYADLLSLLDSSAYGSTDPIQTGYIPRLYGFKAIAQGNDLPSGVKGVLLPYNSIAIASRPVGIADTECYSEYGTVKDENGFTLTILRHGSPATGGAFVNATCLFGAGFVKKSNVKYIRETP